MVRVMERAARFTIRRYDNLKAMKAAEYAYWQQQPAHARMDAVADITAETYGLKDPQSDAPRLQRALVRIKR